MSVRTADKYIMIHDAFGTQATAPKTATRPNWNKYQGQLPVDWTMMHQFARLYSKIPILKKAEKLFLEVYDLSITPEVDPKGVVRFPTVEDIASVVAEHIIDNDPVKKERNAAKPRLLKLLRRPKLNASPLCKPLTARRRFLMRSLARWSPMKLQRR